MAAKPKEYVVTGEYVTLKTMTTEGVRYVGLHRNAPVPADVPQEQVDHHLKMGLIHERGWVPPDPADTSAEHAASYAAGLLSTAEAELEKAQRARDEAKAGVERVKAAEAERAKAAADAEAEQAAAEQADADARKAAEAVEAALAKQPSKAAAARAAKGG